MPGQLDGNTINKSQGVSCRPRMCKSIAISQTKVSYSQSATGKLILMTMIGTLISIAPARCFLSPYFNISPFPGFWCLTEWKAKNISATYLKGHTEEAKPGRANVTVNVFPAVKYDETGFSSHCVLQLYVRRKEEIIEWKCRWNLIFDGKPSGVS